MKLAALGVLVLVSSYIPQVLSRPNGALAGGCSSLTLSRSPNAPQTSSIPYSVDLRAFHVDKNGLIRYTPGMSYSVTLTAPGGRPMFQGFLIQARLVTDDTTVVGSFSPEAFSPGVRLSSCHPAGSTITHSDNTNKSSVTAIWTAPSTNKGTIYFAFAVVQQYGTFWADQRTTTIHGGFQHRKIQTNFGEEEIGKPRLKRQGDSGIGLVFQRERVANHGFLIRGQIGTADEDTVMCVTDNTACCSRGETGERDIGNWYFPNGSVVPSESAGTQFYMSRGPGVVRLHRRRGGVPGIYRCRIPDASGESQDLYVGLYTTTTGRPHTTSINFTLTSELNPQTPTFTLTCISEGGPVERVDWVRISGTPMQDGSTYDISGPVVVDTELAIYHHTLTVTGRLPDGYACRVISNRPQSAGEVHIDTKNINIVAADPPTIVSAEQVGNTTAVKVTWTPPTGGATVTGYRIYYDEGFRDVGNGGATEDTFTLPYGTHTITMVALSQHLPSVLSNSVTVTVAPPDSAPPTGPPLNFEVTVEGPRDLSFSWDPPAEDLRNGVITGYQLSCSPQPNGLPRIFNQSDFNSEGGVEVTLSGFAPTTTYSCSVLASTIAGSGPADNKEVTTEDDSILFQLQLTGIHTCAEWVLQDTAAKLRDIQSAVQENIERLCQCGFSEEHLPETESVPTFQCFSNTKVTFRARLVGTAQATSSELISDMEQWIADGATINVQREVLELDSTCQPVAITAVSDPQCLEPVTPTTDSASDSTSELTPTTDSASTGADAPYTAIVGGVVVLIIVAVLAIVVVVIVILVVKSRRSKLQLKQEGNSRGGAVELAMIGDTKDYDVNFQNMVYESSDCHSSTDSVPTTSTVSARTSQDHAYDMTTIGDTKDYDDIVNLRNMVYETIDHHSSTDSVSTTSTVSARTFQKHAYELATIGDTKNTDYEDIVNFQNVVYETIDHHSSTGNVPTTSTVNARTFQDHTYGLATVGDTKDIDYDVNFQNMAYETSDHHSSTGSVSTTSTMTVRIFQNNEYDFARRPNAAPLKDDCEEPVYDCIL